MPDRAEAKIVVDTHVGRYDVSLAIKPSTTVQDLVDQLPAEALKHWRGNFIYYKSGSLSMDDNIHNVLGQNADTTDFVSFLQDTIHGGYFPRC